jgi:hypothetical protein
MIKETYEISLKERLLERQETAYHEAGHVAMCLYYKLVVYYVTIIPNKRNQSLGHVRFINPENDFFIRKNGTPGKKRIAWLNKSAHISIAGRVAEMKLTGYTESAIKDVHEFVLERSKDYIDFEEAADELQYDRVGYCEWVTNEVLKLFRKSAMQDFIFMIAQLLLKEKKLRYQDCKFWYNRLVTSQR